MAKTLIELMVEAEVQWPEGSEYAVQNLMGGDLCFYREKPDAMESDTVWSTTRKDHRYIAGKNITLPELACDWPQAIVTRDQYQEAIDRLNLEDIRANRDIITIPDGWYGGSAQPTTIEQRIDQLLAMEKQVSEMRLALTKDLEAIWLTWMASDPVSQYQEPEPEPLNITDWRDLRDGDIVEITGSTNSSCGKLKGQELKVSIRKDGETVTDVHFGEWRMLNNTQWRFIRRP